MEDGPPMAPNRLIRTLIQPNSDLIEKLVPLPIFHKDVPGEGFEKFNVLVRTINAFPIEMSNVNNFEQTAFLDLFSVLVQFPGAGPVVIIYRFTFADLVINGLDFAKERVSPNRKNVVCVPKCQMSAGAKDLPCFFVLYFGINPFPSGRCENKIKPTLLPWLPRFETPVDYVNVHSDKILACSLCEISAKFNASYSISPLG